MEIKKLKKLFKFDYEYQYHLIYDVFHECVILRMQYADLMHREVRIDFFDVLHSALSAYRNKLFSEIEVWKRLASLEEKKDGN